MIARKIVVFAALVLFAACRPGSTGAPAPGASSSDAAIRDFLSAARAQDLQALSAVWGNAEGPARDRMERQELERRLLIMMCHLRHDESRIGQSEAGEAGRTLNSVELKQEGKIASTKFTTVRNTKSGRWFVEDFDLAPLRAFCTKMPPPGGGRVPPA
ncbi:MAG TPA: hypothetical protein VM764_08490 [Gemmatimonadaceae bacterium]|nr:hypothetical protein [Gemmatimonadaceae bacterium]